MPTLPRCMAVWSGLSTLRLPEGAGRFGHLWGGVKNKVGGRSDICLLDPRQQEHSSFSVLYSNSM